MDFAEKVLSVGVTMGVAIALFCCGYAWAQKASVFDGKLDENTAYQKVPVTYEQKVAERDSWTQRIQAETSNKNTAETNLANAVLQKDRCNAELAEMAAIGVMAKVAPVVNATEETIEP